MKNFNIKDVCYNEECKHNDKCICYLKGVRPNGCIHAITKWSLDLRAENLAHNITDKNKTITIKDKLIAQLEDQNDRLIKERDDALAKAGESYIYCTHEHGKFKSANKLFESYLQLEKEYTKSRQALVEKDRKIKNFEELNEKYPYHYSEEYMADYKRLKETNQRLIELKAKEMGGALSDAFNNFTVAIRNKLDKETILEYLRTHNQDKLKMLEDIKETLEDINDYLMKKGDITERGSDKILDYIDCKIDQQKGDKNETN